MSADEVTVLVVDDQRLVREGVRLLLDLVDGARVVAEAADGREALAVIAASAPDVVLADARMPGMDGAALVTACRDRHPQLPVIVLTTFDDDDVVHAAVDAGAAGFLLKDVSPEVLVDAVLRVHRGEVVIDPRVARAALRRSGPTALGTAWASLTPTERVVAGHVADGLSNREIAVNMVLAEGTVKNHVSSLLRKLAARDRTALVLQLLRLDRPDAQPRPAAARSTGRAAT